jgi:hypothetical protein
MEEFRMFSVAGFLCFMMAWVMPLTTQAHLMTPAFYIDSLLVQRDRKTPHELCALALEAELMTLSEDTLSVNLKGQSAYD